MADLRFRLNPEAAALPGCSAVLNGRGTHYQMHDYRTTLSLKSVVRGAARYWTPQGHYLVTPDTFLILNHGQRYSMEFDGQTNTETLCPFFQPGFMEQAKGEAEVSAARQLDEVEVAARTVDFCERLYPKTGSVARALAELHRGLRSPQKCGVWLEDRFYELARALAEVQIQVRDEAQEFPGLRAATRMELYRRLYRARDFMLSCYDQPLTVAAVARVATLSPFHFQRSFKLAFGRTPMQFLQETRLQAARRLLAQSRHDITTICLAAGFQSLGSFSWLFSKRFGIGPRAFRNGQNRRIEEVSPHPGL